MFLRRVHSWVGTQQLLASALRCISLRTTFSFSQVYDAAEFEALTSKYDKLNWRIISKPGGATVKPDEYYPLYG